MVKYSELSKEHKNLVLLELIINQPQSKCALGDVESVKKARDEAAGHIEVIMQHAKFLKDSARLMGIDPRNPEEYIAQVIMEERLRIAQKPSEELPPVKYANY